MDLSKLTFEQWIILISVITGGIIITGAVVALLLRSLKKNVKSVKIPGPKGDINVVFNNEQSHEDFKAYYTNNDEFEEASALIGSCRTRVYSNKIESEKRTLRESESRIKNTVEMIHEELDKKFAITINFMEPIKYTTIEQCMKFIKEILKENHLAYKIQGSKEKEDFLHEKSLNMLYTATQVFIENWPIFPVEGTCQELPDYQGIKSFFKDERIRDKIVNTTRQILEEMITIALEKQIYEEKMVKELDEDLIKKFKMSAHMVSVIKTNMLGF